MASSKDFVDSFRDNHSSSGPSSESQISQSIARVREKIQRTCIESGRDPRSVKLVAVTKTRSVEEIKFALESGLEDLGENYLQEAREKARKLPGARWHMVGNLQKNKVNLAVDLFEVVHSLDNLGLILRLENRCRDRHRKLTGLLQVNLSQEKTKNGLFKHEIFALLDELAQTPPEYLRLSGLMTIPPAATTPEDNRPYFAELKSLMDEIVARDYPFWHGRELSMGMSDDYPVAIEEGATLIRVGTSLFGSR